MNRTCETCRHATPAPIDPNNLAAPRQLNCKRYPPGIFGFLVGHAVANASAFPTVTAGDTCGEFAPWPPHLRAPEFDQTVS